MLELLRSNGTLCSKLEYDPSTEHNADAGIQEADPPWEVTRSPVVFVTVEKNNADRDNAAKRYGFVVTVTLQVSEDWYKRDFVPGERYRIMELLDQTLLDPPFQSLRKLPGIEFNRTPAGENFERAWSSVYNYERMRVYRDEQTTETQT